MKIVFFATTNESLDLLIALSNKHEILAVISKRVPDNSKRRNFEKTKIFEYSYTNKILFLEPTELNRDFEDKIKELKPDLFVVVSYGKILKKNLIQMPKFGTINIHPSLLPLYRGPSPIQNTILNQDISSGFTIIQMNEGVDSGDILYKSKKFTLTQHEKYEDLLKLLFFESSKVINSVLTGIEKNKLKPQRQNIKEASYTKLIKKESGIIDWNKTDLSIYAKYRAFYNWPKIYSFHLQKRFIIHNLKLSEIKSNSPGKLEKINGNIYVHTSTNLLQLESIQLEGKKPINASVYFNNFDLSKIILKTN
jgi:methionyl-tRNA formyltransferase